MLCPAELRDRWGDITASGWQPQMEEFFTFYLREKVIAFRSAISRTYERALC